MPAFYDLKRTLKGLLSQKEYSVYLTKMCSDCHCNSLSPFLGISTEFAINWHFPLVGVNVEIWCLILTTGVSFRLLEYLTASQPRWTHLKQTNT